MCAASIKWFEVIFCPLDWLLVGEVLLKGCLPEFGLFVPVDLGGDVAERGVGNFEDRIFG
jgi:hypothetical protein